MHKDSKTKKATALMYNEDLKAPLVLYNGRANIVQTMLDIAEKHDIPIVYEPETQEILSLFDAGDFVPEETWEVLAKVFAFVRGQLETTSTNR